MMNITKRKLWLFFLWALLFLVQNWLQQYSSLFQYVDELYALTIIPALGVYFVKKKEKPMWTKDNIIFVFLLLLFWACGWGGYFRYRYQPFVNVVKDAYVNLKFFMALGASFLMFYDEQVDFDKMKERIWPVLNAITMILFVLCLADLCFGIFSTETRGGLRAVKLFYSAYTILVGHCVFLSAMYLCFFEKKTKQIIWPLLMLSFVMLSTRRVKAMGAAAGIVLIYLLVFYGGKKISKKIKVFCGGVLVAALAAALFQIVSYYYTMGVASARAVLTIGGPFVAMDHFPTGSGWATYGSTFSTDPYSPVYGMYRMAGVWGISPDYHDFVSDTFWPMIMGQCGFFGFFAYVGVVILLFRKVMKLKYNKSGFAAAIFPLLYLLISSSSESAFANPMAVPMAFWIGFLLAEHKVFEKRKQEIEQ